MSLEELAEEMALIDSFGYIGLSDSVDSMIDAKRVTKIVSLGNT